jgi:hypothetical protein
MFIREEQQGAMSQRERGGFEARAFEYLSGKVRRPATPDADEQLRQAIARGIGEARSLAITREVDVIRYLELTLVLGPARLSSPRFQWIDDYLREHSPAEERLDLIVERLRFDTELRK